MWTPAAIPPMHPSSHALSETDKERIKDKMIHVWEEDTQASYSAGLLMWHCFCDGRATPEAEWAPAGQALLSAFIAHMATTYLGKTISNYLNSVRAWHLLHGIPWALEKRKMDVML